MLKMDEFYPNFNLNPKKSIFLSKQKETKINRDIKINFYNKISCTSKISTPISKNSSHNGKQVGYILNYYAEFKMSTLSKKFCLFQIVLLKLIIIIT